MKSKRKGLALLLILMMLVSMNPAIVFSEDIYSKSVAPAAAEDTDPASDTPEELLLQVGDPNDEAGSPEDGTLIVSGSTGGQAGDVQAGDGSGQDGDVQSAGDGSGQNSDVQSVDVQSAGDGSGQDGDVQSAGDSSGQDGDVQSAGDDSGQDGDVRAGTGEQQTRSRKASGTGEGSTDPSGSGTGDTEDGTAETAPSDVYDSLGNAIGSEFEAAREFFPQPELWYEIGAIANEVAAAKALNDAEDIVEQNEEQTEEAAGSAAKSEQQAREDAGYAKGYADSAWAVEDTASKALQKAKDAQTREEALDAAAEAGAASTVAQSAAADAVARAESADAEARKARTAYEEALAAYEAAEIEVREKLDQGLLNAQEAAELTAAAAERADQAYDKMLAAQDAANKAAEEAAQRAADADQALDDQVKALDDAIKVTASTVKKNTETAVLTGAALAAAKLVAKASNLEIEYYNGRIEAKQEDIDELSKKIDDAKAKIEAAQEEVDAARYVLDEADRNYKEKAAELEDAEKALDIARKVVADAEMIRAEREIEGAADALDAVMAGEATTEQNQIVAGLLLRNGLYNTTGESLSADEWDGEDIVKVTKGEETKYYKVEAPKDGDSDFSYHFTEVEPKTEKDAPKPDSSVWSGISGSDNTKDTSYITRDLEDGSVGSVQIVRSPIKVFGYTIGYNYDYQISVNGNTYKLSRNSDGTYSYTADGQSHNVQLVELTDKYYVPVEGGSEISGSGSKVLEIWDAAETDAKAAAYREVKRDAVKASSLEVAIAERALVKAKNNEWIRLQDEIDANEQKIKDLDEEQKELDKKLRGNIAEQILITYLEEGSEAATEAVYDAVRAGDISVGDIWEIIAQISKQGSSILDVMGTVTDGELNLADAEAVINMIRDGGLSARTRGYIIDKIVEFLDKAHRNAVNDLKSSVRDGAKNISEATVAVAEAGVEAVSAHADKAVADVLKKAADKLTEEARSKKDAADRAAEDAANALADYEALMAEYGPDDANVASALEAWKSAEEYADEAARYADSANSAARKAEQDYQDALAEAGKKPGPKPAPTPTPTPAPDPTPTPAPTPTPDPDKPVVPDDPDKPVNPDDPDKPVDPDDQQDSDDSGGSSSAGNYGSSFGTGIESAVAASTVSGIDIARYAASLKGDKYTRLVDNDKTRLNSKAFVDYVYSHFDIHLDLDGRTVEDIAGNGELVDNDKRKAGDLLVITDESGNIAGYGVNYDKDTFVRYSKKSGEVRIFETKTLKDNYRVVRVV